MARLATPHGGNNVNVKSLPPFTFPFFFFFFFEQHQAPQCVITATKKKKKMMHDEFERDDLSCFRGLVLDISYRPINVVCWKRAICLEFMDKIPHLLQVVKRRRVNCNLSRYCSARENLTIDDAIPIARGGERKWKICSPFNDEQVTACAKCNSKKGQTTLEEASMKLNKIPKAPKDYDILAIPPTTAAIKMLKMRKGTPEE